MESCQNRGSAVQSGKIDTPPHGRSCYRTFSIFSRSTEDRGATQNNGGKPCLPPGRAQAAMRLGSAGGGGKPDSRHCCANQGVQRPRERGQFPERATAEG